MIPIFKPIDTDINQLQLTHFHHLILLINGRRFDGKELLNQTE